MKNGEYFRDTYAGKGSELHTALANSEETKAMAIYKATTHRFDALYPPGDRQWFQNWSHNARPDPHLSVL